MKTIPRIPGRQFAAIAIAFLLAWTTPLLALQERGRQEPQEQSQPKQQSKRTAQVDEVKLEAVAKAYLKVEEIEKSYNPKIESARSAEERQKLEQEAMREMAKAIEDQEGVNVEEFNQIMTAAQTDDQLRQRLAAKIQEARQETEGNQKTEE